MSEPAEKQPDLLRRDLCVAFVLPTSMAARGLLATPVMERFLEHGGFRGVVLSPSNREKKQLQTLGCPGLAWRSIYHPMEGSLDLAQRARRLCRSACSTLIRLLGADFPNLVYRFNEINGFVGHRQKAVMSDERKAREARAGNFVDPRLGRPNPKSRSLFDLLFRLYFGRWQCTPPAIDGFMQLERPDVVVLWNPQNSLMKDYLVAAEKSGVPVVVVITSWDMPTTKGPLCPGARRYIVNSRAMKRELVDYHRIPGNRIDVSGWPQMDVCLSARVMERGDFLERLGIPAGNRLIVFAANSERLGQHEPSVAAHLAEQVGLGTYGPCSLLIRPHPKDGNWQQRFGGVLDKEGVTVEPPDWGRLDHLSGLMRHADVVVASQGSITMDAVAQDSCVINIAFDGDAEVAESESVKKWYQMDHYQAVIDTEGVWMVNDYTELDDAVAAYLKDPGLKAGEREQLRRMQLDPMDGKASSRIASAIMSAAAKQTAATATEPAGSVVGV